MKAIVTMSSGDQDTWNDIADVVDDRASLAVIYEIEGDEVPEGTKTMQVHSQTDNGPDLPHGEMVQTFGICAIYSPGMWMKVEFE